MSSVPPLVVSAFLMGVFGGLHCVAMCGGVVGVLCSAAPRCGNTGLRAASGAAAKPRSYWLAYNAGRVGSYAVLGALVGALGTLSQGAFPLDGVRFGLRAIAALCMLFVGLHLMGLPSIMHRVEAIGAPIWRRVSPLTARFLPLRRPSHALVVGAMWGLMPCGLLYGALALAASAESAQVGAMTTAAFGVGTLPVMVAMSAFATGVRGWLSRAWVRRTAGLIVLGFGVLSSVEVAAQVAPVGGREAGRHCCPTR